MVRVGRLELPASCSQSKRATNCATPGYEIFQLWSNMGSAPVFDQFPARGKTPSALASQSFPGFWRSVARTPASRSQSKRATNCATPGHIAPAAGPERGPGQFPGSSYCTKSGPDVKGFLADGTPSRLPAPRRRRTRRCTTPGDSSTDSPPGRRPWCRTAPPLRHR